MKAKTKLIATQTVGFASVLPVLFVYNVAERHWGGYEAVALAIVLLVPVSLVWRYFRFRYFEEEKRDH